MSLVSEALRKARRERAERLAHEQGRALPPTGVGEAPRRAGLRLMAGAALAVLAGVFGGIVAWWFLAQGGDPDTTSGPPDQGAAAVVAERVAVPEQAASQPVELDGPQTERPEIVPRLTANAESRPAVSGGVASVEEQDVGSAEPPPTATPAPVEQTSGAVPVAQGPREFVAEARLGDVTLTLGYLVFRQTDPFAEINGTTAFVGTVVEGFRVDEIRRDRVVLSDQHGPVVIRVQ